MIRTRVKRIGGQSLTACGYLRCSTDEQGATSIPQQKREIEQWSVQNKIPIVEWFIDEGVSGTTFEDRPAFLRMTDEIESAHPRFNTVLVYDESRWGRAIKLRENSFWKTYFDKKGVLVRLIHSNSRNGNHLSDFITEVVESAEASEYSRKLSRSIIRGMTAQEQGAYSRGGTAPYGYKRVAIDLATGDRRELRDGLRSSPKQEKVVWELGEALEVATVSRIFEMKAKGVGYRTIADTLNGERIPSPRRGRWRNRDTMWSRPTIFGIIQNRSYTGTRVYNRLSFSPYVAEAKNLPEFNGRRMNDPKDWIVIENAHPAIVTAKLFEEANKERAAEEARQVRGAQINQHYYRSGYLLTGLIRCARCGYTFQGFTHKRSGRGYYVDGGRKNKGKAVCRWFAVPQGELERLALRGVREVLCTPEMLLSIERELRKLMEDEPSTLDEKLKMVRLLLENNANRRKRLIESLEAGVPSTTVMERLAVLEAQRKELDMEVSTLSREIDQHTLTKDGKRLQSDELTRMIREFFLGFEERFARAPIEEKKELMRMIIEKIEIDPEEHRVTNQYKRIPTGFFEREGISKVEGEKYRLLSVALTGIEPVFRP